MEAPHSQDDDYWGTLINADKSAAPLLEQLCLGLVQLMVQHLFQLSHVLTKIIEAGPVRVEPRITIRPDARQTRTILSSSRRKLRCAVPRNQRSCAILYLPSVGLLPHPAAYQKPLRSPVYPGPAAHGLCAVAGDSTPPESRRALAIPAKRAVPVGCAEPGWRHVPQGYSSSCIPGSCRRRHASLA